MPKRVSKSHKPKAQKKRGTHYKKVTKNKRGEYPYPGIAPWLNPKTRAELIDHDYISKLSEEEKIWLSKFNEEYLSGTFEHDSTDFHKGKKRKRDCYSRNNARNRDVFSRNRTYGWVGNDETPKRIMEQTPTSPESQENALIDLLDAKIKKDQGASE